MRIDHTTYANATKVSIWGFILQLVTFLTVLIFGFAVKDDVTVVAGLYIGLGLLVWGAMGLLYYQHRLERLEAMEAEQLRKDVHSAGSIFDLDDEGMNQAAKRLRWMYRFLIPTASLIVAVMFIIVGFMKQRALAGKLGLVDVIDTGSTQLLILDSSWAPYGLAISVVIALICFVFSRYIAGMSRQPAWRDLRGGAATIVGVAVVNVALALAYGVLISSGSDVVMQVLARVMPWFVILVGIEIAANLVINLYRPRRPGEYPRAAFDSRVLGLLAAPDTVVKSIGDALNYHLGFEVTSTWFYQLMSRQLLPLVGLALGVLIALNCVGIVNPHEQAILFSFGSFARTDERGEPRIFESGLVFKLPWHRLDRFSVSRIQQVSVGTEPIYDDKAILWGSKHGSEEELILVREEAFFGTNGSKEAGAADFAVLNAEIPIQYRIKSGVDRNGKRGLLNYIMLAPGIENQRTKLIEMTASRLAHRYCLLHSIDDILGPGRTRMAGDLRVIIQAELDRINAGVEVVFVGAAGIHPPVGTDSELVAKAFEKVLEAEEGARAEVQIAYTDATRRLAGMAGSIAEAEYLYHEIRKLEPLATDSDEYHHQLQIVNGLILQANGDAAEMLYEARADRWSRHMDARRDAMMQNSSLLPYRAAPQVYRMREYLDVLVMAIAHSQGTAIIAAADVPLKPVLILENDPTAGFGRASRQYEKSMGN